MRVVNRQRVLCGQLLTMGEAGREPEGPQLVEIDEGRRIAAIRAVRESGDVDREGLIDLSRYTVLPGLIDGHSHLEMIDILAGNEAQQTAAPDHTLALRAAANGLFNLRHGITTMRLAGTKNYLDVPLKALFDRGDLLGPRLVIAGRGLTSSHSENVNSVTADGIDGVTQAVRANIARNVDFIKVFASSVVGVPRVDPTAPLYSAAELSAIVEIAHEFGRPVAAHAYGGTAIDRCLDLGVDHIEHGILMKPEQFDRVAELGRWLVGTLGVFLTEPGFVERDSLPAEIRSRFQWAREATARSVGEAKRAGVKLALGTDAIHGAIAQEAMFAASNGLTNREALAAITRNAAELCGLAGQVGAVIPGAWADLIAVDGNPLDDLRHLREVRFVMKGGEPLPRPGRSLP